MRFRGAVQNVLMNHSINGAPQGQEYVITIRWSETGPLRSGILKPTSDFRVPQGGPKSGIHENTDLRGGSKWSTLSAHGFHPKVIQFLIRFLEVPHSGTTC